jgi:hypothetical protein
MREVAVGSLVAFVTVDRGIDIDTPSGTLTRKMSDRLTRSRVYYPGPGEVGLVVAGPETAEDAGFRVWHVLVGGSNWWFTDDEIVCITRD